MLILSQGCSQSMACSKDGCEGMCIPEFSPFPTLRFASQDISDEHSHAAQVCFDSESSLENDHSDFGIYAGGRLSQLCTRPPI